MKSRLPQKKRCDFLLFVHARGRKGHWTVPVELKSGTIKFDDLDDIREQLQAGADVAAKLLASEPVAGDPIRLRPILGYGDMPLWLQQNLTRSEFKVTLGSYRELIRPMTSGGQIGDVLRQDN